MLQATLCIIHSKNINDNSVLTQERTKPKGSSVHGIFLYMEIFPKDGFTVS